MKNIFLFLSFLFLMGFSFSQDVENVLKKMNGAFANVKTMEYNCVYDLYKGPTSTTVHSSYAGYVYKEGNKIYQKIKDTETIYGSDFFLKINHEEKAMVLDKGQKNVDLDIDLETALKECSEKSIVKKKGYYSVKLIFKKTSEVPFSVVFLRINISTYFIEQLDIYYSYMQDFSTEMNKKDEALPHLKIKFTNINTKPKAKSSLVSLVTYLKTQNNLLKPTGSCIGYELIDNRL